MFTLPKIYVCQKSFIDMQIQRIQRFKNHLMGSYNKALTTSTASGDQQLVSSKHLQKTKAENKEISQKIAYSECANEYNWEQDEIPTQNIQYSKEQWADKTEPM